MLIPGSEGQGRQEQGSEEPDLSLAKKGFSITVHQMGALKRYQNNFKEEITIMTVNKYWKFTLCQRFL